MASFKYNDVHIVQREGLMKLIQLFLVLLLSIASVQPISAETVFYDNLTTTPYKTYTIDDDMNIKYISEYGYKVYINSQYLGEFKKGESFEYPDNSNITIHAPSPVKTDLNKGIDLGTSLLYIAVLGFLAVGIVIYLIWLLIKRMRR